MKKNWIDILIGVGCYLIWEVLTRSLNVFIAYSASIPLFIIFFFLLLCWSLFRRNLKGLCALTGVAVVPPILNGLRTVEGGWGIFFFVLVPAYCLWQIFNIPAPSKHPVKKGKVRNSPSVPSRWNLLGRTTILVFLLLVGVRQSDLIVSKLYFVPWPIYSDYTYPEGVQKVFFKSLDGTMLNGWYFHGKSPDASKRPVLLYVHGNAGNMAAQLFQFSFLMDWGYDVFAFDYRGFGLSEGHPSRQGLWKDTQAAFQEMTMLAPNRKYAVVGFSMGGPYALQLVTHESRVSEAAIFTCFSSFREIGIYTMGTWGVPKGLAPFLGWLLIPNGLDARDAELIDPLTPALFVQGTWDGNIPFAMTEKMAAGYGGPHEFLPMPNYPHGDYFKGPLGDKFHQALDGLFIGKGDKK